MKSLRMGRLCLIIMAFAAARAMALELKTRPWPLTDAKYDPIDAESVRVDSYVPETKWLEQVGQNNAALAEDLTLKPLATMDVLRLSDEDEIDSEKPLLDEARHYAAHLGANIVSVEQRLKKAKELDGLRFMLYRAEYKDHLISPLYLAALPNMSVPASFLEEQLASWQEKHFGKSVGPTMLASLKTGWVVRVFLRDGSDLKGHFNGMDDEQRLWIHPSGWAGLFRDRAVPTADVQSIAILD